MGHIPEHSTSVIIADDDALVRTVLRLAMEAAGHRVTEAVDGVELLAMVSECPFDLCVMDDSMPGPALSDRLQLLRLTRPSMALAVISGYRARPECIEASGTPFLSKPIELAALSEVLADLRTDRADQEGRR
jgi:CheY-like chemotaxis protein